MKDEFIPIPFQLFTDGWFLEAMDLYLKQRFEQKSKAPTYVYLFTHKGSASFTEIFHGGRDNYFGTAVLNLSKNMNDPMGPIFDR